MCRTAYSRVDYEWVLIGIASFRHTSGCASGIPDVFTRVTLYNQWIIDQIDDNGGPY